MQIKTVTPEQIKALTEEGRETLQVNINRAVADGVDHPAIAETQANLDAFYEAHNRAHRAFIADLEAFVVSLRS